MKREDWSIPAIIFEAVDILAGIAYCAMQIYYGHLYHVPIYKIGVNVLVAILIYVSLTLLAMYPERINNLSSEVCTGKIRRYSIRMVRMEKCFFLFSLLVPCICDVIGFHLPPLYNVAVIILMLIIAVYHEVRIVLQLRS